MSAIALLMGLLLLSYVGSLIVGGRSAKGLPSGVEFIALGAWIFAGGVDTAAEIARAQATITALAAPAVAG